MNLIDAEVLEVLSKPVFKYNHWFVKVRYDSWGVEGITEIMVETQQQAININIGYIFQV